MAHKKKEHAHTSSPSSEVHLRRLTVDEALLRLDKYLNDAFMVGLWQVRVVYGKGTGTLRQAALIYEKVLQERNGGKPQLPNKSTIIT